MRFDPPTTIVRELARRVAAAPERLAVQDADRALTYSELDREANRVARTLLARGGAGPVGVLLGQTVSAVTALLGCSKAGRIRVPLDASTPPAKLRERLEHAEVSLVVTDASHRALLSDESSPSVLDIRLLPTDVSDADPGIDPDPAAPAALVFTSGSSGRPKAVLFGHADLVAGARTAYWGVPVAPEDRYGVVADLSFSVARSADTALLAGASIHLYDLRKGGAPGLARWLAEDRISRVVVMSSVLGALLDELPEGPNLTDLRLVAVGGEPLAQGEVDRFRARTAPGCRLVHGYGSTEAGVVMVNPIDRAARLPPGVVSPGKPLPGVEVELLDADANGVGELAVRSPAVTLGYWRDEELTRERFRPPASLGAPRTFLTGDLARLGPDGMLEILGRSDARVKIRGHGVDLAEVEATLNGAPEVARSAVVKADGGRLDGRLVAYVVPAEGARPTVTRLRSRLLERLPPYMVPAAFVPVVSLPLTVRGKLDRAALPEPGTDRPELEVPFVPPRGDLQCAVAESWEEVLGVRPVGAHDDFYALGGDSLSAARARLVLAHRLGVEVPLLVFAGATATAVSVAEQLDSRTGGSLTPVVPLQPEGSALPFFCVSGIGGEVLDLFALAELLAPDLPFYALRPVGSRGDRAVRSVPSLARYYVEALETADPGRPYVLGGYSSGGTIAFEMALQLAARGEPPAALVLLDTACPGSAEDPPDERPSPGEPSRRWRKRALRGVLELHVRARRPVPVQWRTTYHIQQGRRSIRAYRPEPYSGEVTLLQTNAPEAPEGLGWNAVARGGLRVYPVPGDHHSMLVSPFVRSLADTLREVIAEHDPAPHQISLEAV